MRRDVTLACCMNPKRHSVQFSIKSGIDIWYLKLDGDVDLNDLWHAYLPVLSPDEQLRASMYPSKRDAELFLIARILVRTSLSHYANVAPERWNFGVTSTGRPFITSLWPIPELHFNLSHTDGLIVCAISRLQELGIDAENIQRRMISLAMAKKYLAPAEFRQVQNLASELRQRALIQYWTLKEAYAKARGMGIGLPLTTMEFELCEVESDCFGRFSDEIEEKSSAWFFRQIKISEAHVCSLAYRAQSPETIRLHQFMPFKLTNTAHTP